MTVSSPNFLATTRAAGVKSRMGPDLRTAIEYHPALAGLALWVGFRDVEEAEFIAATDGKTVFAGPAYEAYLPVKSSLLCFTNF
jgi:hypothetical protein